ncbi:MAG: hypothetical protein U0V02_13045 [Anaerolineales bacterium]
MALGTARRALGTLRVNQFSTPETLSGWTASPSPPQHRIFYEDDGANRLVAPCKT